MPLGAGAARVGVFLAARPQGDLYNVTGVTDTRPLVHISISDTLMWTGSPGGSDLVTLYRSPPGGGACGTSTAPLQRDQPSRLGEETVGELLWRPATGDRRSSHLKATQEPL